MGMETLQEYDGKLWDRSIVTDTILRRVRYRERMSDGRGAAHLGARLRIALCPRSLLPPHALYTNTHTLLFLYPIHTYATFTPTSLTLRLYTHTHTHTSYSPSFRRPGLVPLRILCTYVHYTILYIFLHIHIHTSTVSVVKHPFTLVTARSRVRDLVRR